MTAHSLVLALESTGYEVLHARCGKEARPLYEIVAEVAWAAGLLNAQACPWCHGQLGQPPRPHAYEPYASGADVCTRCDYTEEAGNHTPPPEPWRCPKCGTVQTTQPGMQECTGCKAQVRVND